MKTFDGGIGWPLVLLVAYAMVLASCGAEDLFGGPYDNCCETPPFEWQANGHQVFIPNVITPDQRGDDEFLTIYSRQPITLLDLDILHEDEILGISRTEVAIEGSTMVWKPTNSSGMIFYGQYHYTAKALIAGDTIALAGQFCAIDCRDRAATGLSQGCVPYSATDGKGHIDTSQMRFNDPCSP